MSRNPIRRTPPIAGRPPTERLALDEFASRLHSIMKERGLSQSDLARLVWGTRVDERGYEVAKGRDAIHRYLAGQSWPEPKTLTALANALGVPESELAPDVDAAIIQRARPELALTSVHGRPGVALLDVYMTAPISVAAKVIAILTGPEGRASDTAPTTIPQSSHNLPTPAEEATDA